jgi:hypothetical protein
MRVARRAGVQLAARLVAKSRIALPAKLARDAKRDSDPDLRHSPRHGKRHHAIEAHHRECCPKSAEQPDERRADAAR